LSVACMHAYICVREHKTHARTDTQTHTRIHFTYIYRHPKRIRLIDSCEHRLECRLHGCTHSWALRGWAVAGRIWRHLELCARTRRHKATQARARACVRACRHLLENAQQLHLCRLDLSDARWTREPDPWSTLGAPLEYRWSTLGVPLEYRWSIVYVP
jgi:hypothetical protein